MKKNSSRESLAMKFIFLINAFLNLTIFIFSVSDRLYIAREFSPERIKWMIISCLSEIRC